jgi:hypothetical protein
MWTRDIAATSGRSRAGNISVNTPTMVAVAAVSAAGQAVADAVSAAAAVAEVAGEAAAANANSVPASIFCFRRRGSCFPKRW